MYEKSMQNSTPIDDYKEIKKETDYNLGGREYPQTDKNHLKNK